MNFNIIQRLLKKITIAFVFFWLGKQILMS